MNVSIRVDSRRFMTKAQRSRSAVRAATRRTLANEIGRKLLRRLKAMTRVRTGRLRRSAFRRVLDRGMTLMFGYTAPYAKYVEGYPINDRNLQRLVRAERPGILASLKKAVVGALSRLWKGR